MKFNGKRILVFSPNFFGYENKIINKLERMGAVVDCYDERSVTKARDKALLKISPKIFSLKTHRYYRKIINKNIDKEYEYIFWNGVSMLDKKVIKMIQTAFPKSILIMYLVDSIYNKRWIESLFEEFNKVITFDRRDYEYYKFQRKLKNIYFRPLYYADCYNKQKKDTLNIKYDICFIGTIHSDRYRIIKELKEWSSENNIKVYTYCYLQSKFVFYFYKLTKKEFRDAQLEDFKFNKLNSEEIVNIVDESRVVMDMQHPLNTGLTMRTLEMLGMKKKLITTNRDVKNYEFYEKDNIYIIDRKCINFSEDFIMTAYKNISSVILDKYSLESWVKDIFEEDKPDIKKFMSSC